MMMTCAGDNVERCRLKMSNFIFQNDSLGRAHREGAGKGSAARHWNSADEIGKLTSRLHVTQRFFTALLIMNFSERGCTT